MSEFTTLLGNIAIVATSVAGVAFVIGAVFGSLRLGFCLIGGCS